MADSQPQLERFTWKLLEPDVSTPAKRGPVAIVFKAKLRRNASGAEASVEVAVKLIARQQLPNTHMTARLREDLQKQLLSGHTVTCFGGAYGDATCQPLGLADGALTDPWRAALQQHDLLPEFTHKDSVTGRTMTGIVMCWESLSLADVLYSSPRPPSRAMASSMSHSDKMALLADVATSVCIMHDGPHAVAHGSIKPTNIFLEKKTSSSCRFKVKQADFAQCVLRPRQAECTSSRGVTQRLHTPYMAPERLVDISEGREDAPNSRASDVYSFGVLCWEILSGQKPWASCDSCESEDIMRREVLDAHRPPMKGLRGCMSATMQALIESCWHQDRSHRPRMSEVRSALDWEVHVLGGSSMGARPWDIFLSYERGRGTVECTTLPAAVYSFLRNAGLRVWPVPLPSPGHRGVEDAQDEDSTALLTSTTVVVLASPGYLASSHCASEMKSMVPAGKPILVLGAHGRGAMLDAQGTALSGWLHAFSPPTTRALDAKDVFWNHVLLKGRRYSLDLHTAASLVATEFSTGTPGTAGRLADKLNGVLNWPECMPTVVHLLQQHIEASSKVQRAAARSSVELARNGVVLLAGGASSAGAGQTLQAFDNSFGTPSASTAEEDAEHLYKSIGYSFAARECSSGGHTVFVHSSTQTLSAAGFVEERHGHFDPRLCRAYCSLSDNQCRTPVKHAAGERCCKAHAYHFTQRCIWKRCLDQRSAWDKGSWLSPTTLLRVAMLKLQNAAEGPGAYSAEDVKYSAKVVGQAGTVVVAVADILGCRHVVPPPVRAILEHMGKVEMKQLPQSAAAPVPAVSKRSAGAVAPERPELLGECLLPAAAPPCPTSRPLVAQPADRGSAGSGPRPRAGHPAPVDTPAESAGRKGVSMHGRHHQRPPERVRETTGEDAEDDPH